MAKSKKPAWNHFNIIGGKRVRCKYCPKEFQQAVPKRMQDHLDKKCSEAPNKAKSSYCLSDLSEEEKFTFKRLIFKALSVENLSETDDKFDYFHPENIRSRSESPSDNNLQPSLVEREFLGNYYHQAENNISISPASNNCCQVYQGYVYSRP
ncbi:hypothetical protein C1645_879605 [Glomus cerebriforme]|uniref:BED-type domain-containing protein n=1 Tax=Glomus cerebriforme TaxID=658196 RepID=A0A397SK03_9GLOM|nr:hypothetical protein C1645_879605 [Glomus cerebriforme]